MTEETRILTFTGRNISYKENTSRADFDGDEMNLHVVQSEEARAEARILMRVQEHIRSPRFGGAVIGAIHDHPDLEEHNTYISPS